MRRYFIHTWSENERLSEQTFVIMFDVRVHDINEQMSRNAMAVALNCDERRQELASLPETYIDFNSAISME